MISNDIVRNRSLMFLKMMHAARDQTFSSSFANKIRNRSQVKSVARMTNFVRYHLGARIKSGAFVKARRCCLNVIFRVIIRSIYLNTTENSLTQNSLHTTTKKSHNLRSKRQIILCLLRNYCLAIHETAFKSIFRCAKNSADKELSVKMRGLIMYMFRPSPKTLYLRSFAFFFRPSYGPVHLYCPVFHE